MQKYYKLNAESQTAWFKDAIKEFLYNCIMWQNIWLNVAEYANKSKFLLIKQLYGFLTDKNSSHRRNEGKDQSKKEK